MAASTESKNEIQKMYVGYYGRPGDPAGLEYWAEVLDVAKANGGDISEIIADFGNSQEYLDGIGSGDTASQVNSLYQQMFGRDAEQEGLDYWVGQIDSGAVSLASAALAIANGAQNSDKTALENKVTSANYYTEQVTATGASYGSDDIASAKAIIAKVTDSAKSVVDSKTEVDTALENQGGSGSGETYVLTTGIDVIKGTTGDDTLIGDAATASTSDTVDLGAGEDTVKIVGGAGNTDIPTMTKVETLVLQDNTGNADVSSVSDLKNLKVINSNNTLIYTIANGQSVSIQNMADNETIDFAGNSVESLNLTLNDAGDSDGDTAFLTIDLNSTAQTSVSIATETKASDVKIINSGAKLTTINVSGDKALDLDETVATITTLDASSMTDGGVTADLGASTKAITVTGSAGNDTLTVDASVNVTVDAGAGDDKVIMAATLDKDDSVKGGDGTDTLSLTSAEANTSGGDSKVLAVVSGFETLAISDALAHAQDLTKWSVNRINLEVGASATGTVTMDSGDTIAFTEAGTITANVTTGTVTASVKGASDAGSNSDVVNAILSGDFDEGATDLYTANLSVDFVETLNVTSTGTDKAGNGDGKVSQGSFKLDVLDGDRIETINVTASGAAIEIAEDSTNFTALNTFNASGSTAAVTVTLANATQGVVYTGGSGNDVVTVSNYADKLTGGAGSDTFTFGASASTKSKLDKISDFTVSDGNTDNDKLDIVTGTVAANVTNIDVKGADADGAATDIKATVKNGIITLSGGDASAIDTLSEWFAVTATAGVIVVSNADADAVGTVAFEFDGNTYVVESNDASNDNNTNVNIVNEIELTGLTGVSALVTAAAADSILIA